MWGMNLELQNSWAGATWILVLYTYVQRFVQGKNVPKQELSAVSAPNFTSKQDFLRQASKNNP